MVLLLYFSKVEILILDLFDSSFKVIFFLTNNLFKLHFNNFIFPLSNLKYYLINKITKKIFIIVHIYELIKNQLLQCEYVSFRFFSDLFIDFKDFIN